VPRSPTPQARPSSEPERPLRTRHRLSNRCSALAGKLVEHETTSVRAELLRPTPPAGATFFPNNLAPRCVVQTHPARICSFLKRRKRKPMTAIPRPVKGAFGFIVRASRSDFRGFGRRSRRISWPNLLLGRSRESRPGRLTCPTTCAIGCCSWNARLRPEPPRRQREFAKLVRSLQQ
jgi:hypothetical protein